METHPMRKTMRRVNNAVPFTDFDVNLSPDPVKYRARIERYPLHITRKTVIRRTAYVSLFNEAHDLIAVQYCHGGEVKVLWNCWRPKRWVHSVTVKRAWWTVVGGEGSETRWTKLHMAQAQRDGYNFHYARWLLVKGTGAQDYG